MLILDIFSGAAMAAHLSVLQMRKIQSEVESERDQ